MFKVLANRKQALAKERVAMQCCQARRANGLDCGRAACEKCPAYYHEMGECMAFELAEEAHPIRGFIERYLRKNPKAHKKGGK